MSADSQQEPGSRQEPGPRRPAPAASDGSLVDGGDATVALLALHAHFEEDRQAFVAAIRQDPGWLGDLEIFLSKTLDRFDEPLRARFPMLNQILTSAVPIPVAPVLLSFVLLGVENGGLSVIEAWLDAQRRRLELRAHPQ